MGIHTLGVAQLRHLELVKKFLYALRLNLTEIGLVDVEDRERLDKGDDIEILTLILCHSLVLVGANLLAVLVLDHHIPVDHRKRFLTAQYMGFQVMRLFEG